MPPSDLTELRVLHFSHKDRFLLLSILGYVAFHCKWSTYWGLHFQRKLILSVPALLELPRAPQVGVELDTPALPPPPDPCWDLL